MRTRDIMTSPVVTVTPDTPLKEVARLGPKAFELSAGFLRIPGGDDPLDASAVHPEAYPVVRRILTAVAGASGRADLRSLVGNDIPDLHQATKFLAWAKTRPVLARS